MTETLAGVTARWRVPALVETPLTTLNSAFSASSTWEAKRLLALCVEMPLCSDAIRCRKSVVAIYCCCCCCAGTNTGRLENVPSRGCMASVIPSS